MRRNGRLGVFVLASMLILFSIPIRAQDSDSIAHVRCVVIALKLAAMPTATQQSAGMMAFLYYIGRLEGRVPRLDVEDLIVREVSTMTAADYSSEAQRCGQT
jgi:hypothetical protein